MKKSLIIILAVAMLGAVGLALKSQDTSPQSKAPYVATPATNKETSSTKYKDGTYTGESAETPYGAVQVAAVIAEGKVTDIKFLKMPSSDDRSIEITEDSQPKLKEAAINTQSADIDFITGATSTSYGYQESLQAALDKAKLS